MPFLASIEFSGFRKKITGSVAASLAVDYLLLAGGGGGGGAQGNAYPAGGGGAGGFRTGTTIVTLNAPIPLVVGAGGAGGAIQQQGTNGNPTSYNGISAAGGGGGGLTRNGSGQAGSSGGSGGGGGRVQPGGAGNTPATTPSQGNNGGAANAGPGGAGGGGGAGGVGGAGGTLAGGAGGAGSAYLGVTYAVGGAGGTDTSNSTSIPGVAAAANTGNGGSGAGGSGGGSGAAGGAGGSGIAIISYEGLPRFNQGTISTDGAGTTYHRFTTVGTYSVNISSNGEAFRASGLYSTYRNLYHAEAPTYVDAAPIAYIIAATPTWASNPSVLSIQWKGYFLAPTSGTYTFSMTADDGAYLWVGANATAPTVANSTINNGGAHTAQTRTGSVSLTAGTYYAFRLLWGNSAGNGSLTGVTVTLPDSTLVTDFTGYTFYNTLTNGI